MTKISFAGVACQFIYDEYKSNISSLIAQAIATQDKNFDPNSMYAQKFSDAIAKFEIKPDNFFEALAYFKKTRIEIARTNKKDKDLYNFLRSDESKNHQAGLSKDMTNVTSIYPEKDYPSLSIRYKNLYTLLENNRRNNFFNTANDKSNELLVRYLRQSKQKDDDGDISGSVQLWHLQYVTVANSKKPILVGGVIVKTTDMSKDDIALYGIYNAFSRDVPKLLQHMSHLWSAAQRTTDRTEQVKLIAEFEWLFFYTNPFGRAAASVGEVMSTAMQLKLGLPIRKQFIHLDFYALTMSLQDYIQWRLNNP